MAIIDIQNLTRDYGDNKGVFDVSFSIGEGEVFGFLGPNGAGKTTTIRHLMGFLRSQKGSCQINTLDCWKNRDVIQQDLGYIPGEIAFFDDMTGKGFLDYLAKYRGLRSMNKKEQLLDMFDLDPRGKLKKMSKGMKQKVGIVAAFMHDPQILILDEPTSGLDPLMQSRFIELILEEKKRKKTILMSSHMFEEVEKTCHQVGIIREGRLVEVGDVASLKAAQTKRFEITFANEEMAQSFAKEGFKVESLSQAQAIISIHDEIQKLISTLSRYQVVNLSAPSLRLEEIFMQYYGGDKS